MHIDYVNLVHRQADDRVRVPQIQSNRVEVVVVVTQIAHVQVLCLRHLQLLCNNYYVVHVTLVQLLVVLRAAKLGRNEYLVVEDASDNNQVVHVFVRIRTNMLDPIFDVIKQLHPVLFAYCLKIKLPGEVNQSA